MSVNVKVLNLSTQEELIYTAETMTPRLAVICAHAQSVRKDMNSWQYEERYGHLPREGKHTVSIGDWCALTDRSFL
jgi:hypothetical protein